MRRVLLVFLGGGCGAMARALCLAALASWDRLLPGSVLAVNLLGAFLLGLVVALADEAGLLRAPTRLFLAVGVLGGFTTFSTFGWGAALMVGHNQAGAALLYLAASLAGGLLAVGAGLVAGRELVGGLERAALAILQRLDGRGRRRLGRVKVDIGSIEAEDRPGSLSTGGRRR